MVWIDRPTGTNSTSALDVATLKHRPAPLPDYLYSQTADHNEAFIKSNLKSTFFQPQSDRGTE